MDTIKNKVSDIEKDKIKMMRKKKKAAQAEEQGAGQVELMQEEDVASGSNEADDDDEEEVDEQELSRLDLEADAEIAGRICTHITTTSPVVERRCICMCE